jgi:hypothetical protein
MSSTALTLDDGDSVDLTIGELTVHVTTQLTDDGPVVRLGGVNCDLDGDMPGEYFLVPSGTIAARFSPAG